MTPLIMKMQKAWPATTSTTAAPKSTRSSYQQYHVSARHLLRNWPNPGLTANIRRTSTILGGWACVPRFSTHPFLLFCSAAGRQPSLLGFPSRSVHVHMVSDIRNAVPIVYTSEIGVQNGSTHLSLRPFMCPSCIMLRKPRPPPENKKVQFRGLFSVGQMQVFSWANLQSPLRPIACAWLLAKQKQ